MNKIVTALCLISIASAAYSYDVHHPNLKDAWGLAQQGIQRVMDAQQANKGMEFGGHAAKAIESFKHAQEELIEADKWNDAHH